MLYVSEGHHGTARLWQSKLGLCLLFAGPRKSGFQAVSWQWRLPFGREMIQDGLCWLYWLSSVYLISNGFMKINIDNLRWIPTIHWWMGAETWYDTIPQPSELLFIGINMNQHESTNHGSTFVSQPHSSWPLYENHPVWDHSWADFPSHFWNLTMKNHPILGPRGRSSSVLPVTFNPFCEQFTMHCRYFDIYSAHKTYCLYILDMCIYIYT